jgi:hypothetical protein
MPRLAWLSLTAASRAVAWRRSSARRPRPCRILRGCGDSTARSWRRPRIGIAPPAVVWRKVFRKELQSHVSVKPSPCSLIHLTPARRGPSRAGTPTPSCFRYDAYTPPNTGMLHFGPPQVNDNMTGVWQPSTKPGKHKRKPLAGPRSNPSEPPAPLGNAGQSRRSRTLARTRNLWRRVSVQSWTLSPSFPGGFTG